MPSLATMLLVLPVMGATPLPAGVAVKPCPLDGLPEATVAWAGDGSVWLTEGGDVLVASGTSFPLPTDSTVIDCDHATIRITAFRPGATLALERARIDVSAVLADEAPRRSPLVRIRRALAAGDLDEAEEALGRLDPSVPENAALWLDLARAEAAAGQFAAAYSAVARLDPSLPGRSEVLHAVGVNALATAAAALDAGEPEAASAALETALDIPFATWTPSEGRRLAYLRGCITLARGDVSGGLSILEALVAAHPEEGLAWVAIGDTRWNLGRKKDARKAYDEAARTLAAESWPETMRARCRRCGS